MVFISALAACRNVWVNPHCDLPWWKRIEVLEMSLFPRYDKALTYAVYREQKPKLQKSWATDLRITITVTLLNRISFKRIWKRKSFTFGLIHDHVNWWSFKNISFLFFFYHQESFSLENNWYWGSTSLFVAQSRKQDLF